MNVAIIPARGGSKRIPRKNIKDFCGKPIMAYSIEAAINSNCFDRIIVSTDDDEIAVLAKQCGAEVPFLRPDSLSDDHATTGAVIKHTIQFLKQEGTTVEHVCCIYATAPFVRSSDIKSGFEKLMKGDISYTFSAATFPFPIQRGFRITKDGHVEMFNPECYFHRSQDLEEAYHDAGQFYWGKAEAFIDDVPIFSSQTSPIILPKYRVQDIDTIEDWVRAEMMYKMLQEASCS